MLWDKLLLDSVDKICGDIYPQQLVANRRDSVDLASFGLARFTTKGAEEGKEIREEKVGKYL